MDAKKEQSVIAAIEQLTNFVTSNFSVLYPSFVPASAIRAALEAYIAEFNAEALLNSDCKEKIEESLAKQDVCEICQQKVRPYA